MLHLLLQTLDRPAIGAPEPDIAYEQTAETLAVGAASDWMPPDRQTEARENASLREVSPVLGAAPVKRASRAQAASMGKPCNFGSPAFLDAF